jgi:hypothetical protein
VLIPNEAAEPVKHPHAECVVMRGREMDGSLRVAAAAVETDDDLERWIRRGLTAARSQPQKQQSPW